MQMAEAMTSTLELRLLIIVVAAVIVKQEISYSFT